MTYYNLAFKNFKKSFKDYTIYFITLVLGVCIFYSFNSIESQKAIMDLSEQQKGLMEILSIFISIFSIFISVVLAFLIIYANNFLIRRRKKEFGVYITLGMSRLKLASVLFFEIMILGIFALIAGLIFGVLASQGLSAITAKIFAINISEYKFVFSSTSFALTVLYFSIIFMIVMLFNIIVVSKYKLIDLIYGGRKNEKLKLKNQKLSIFMFIISILSLGIAYYLGLNNSFTRINIQLIIAIILVVIGTFIFFLSLCGFLLELVKNQENMYFKNINMFFLRQLNSKINTNVVSISMICLMLFITITVLSCGISVNRAVKNNTKKLAPYDTSLYVNYITEDVDVLDTLKSNNIDLNKYAKEFIQYKQYHTDVEFKEFINNSDIKLLIDSCGIFNKFNIEAIRVSDYNRLMKFLGKKEVNLENDEVALISNMSALIDGFNSYVKKGNNVKINNKKYKILNTKIEQTALRNTLMEDIPLMFVMPDNTLNDKEPSKTFLNINYKNNSEDKFVSAINEKRLAEKYGLLNMGFNQIYENNAGLSGLAIYISIYIGLIFLITSAAVLALQQLSDATESIERYKILSKVGVDKRMIKKSILLQVTSYFVLPLILAMIHSIFGIKIAQFIVRAFGSYDIVFSAILTAVFMCVVYGAYLGVTYIGYKKVVDME